MQEIIVIDYKVGNIGSILNMFKKIGAKARLSADRDEILSAEKLVLPGVGAFDNGMRGLHASGLLPILQEKVVVAGTPILGICLGMQLLMEASEEGREQGLGWIRGEVKKFAFADNAGRLKIPHMGWNVVQPANNSSLFKGFTEESRFYFVHSYHAVCSDKANVLSTTNYGYDFASAIYCNNIYGVQFHPEKSHLFGMQLLRNFAEI